MRNDTRWIVIGLVAALCVGCGDDDAQTQPDAGGDSGVPMITNAPNNPFPCLNPVASESAGFYLCENGLNIRPQPVTCAPSEDPSLDGCTRDADCGATGFCNCATPDGNSNNVCLTRQAPDCLSDQDCAAGFHCAYVIIGFSDWAIHHLRCQQPTDECATADDCLDGLDAGGVPMSYLACQASDFSRFCDLNGW